MVADMRRAPTYGLRQPKTTAVPLGVDARFAIMRVCFMVAVHHCCQPFINIYFHIGVLWGCIWGLLKQ